MTAAVITGASAGLGAEFTRQLVREFPDVEEFWLIARRVGKAGGAESRRAAAGQ